MPQLTWLDLTDNHLRLAELGAITGSELDENPFEE